MPVSEPLATLTKHWQVRDFEAKRGAIDLMVCVALAHITPCRRRELRDSGKDENVKQQWDSEWGPREGTETPTFVQSPMEISRMLSQSCVIHLFSVQTEPFGKFWRFSDRCLAWFRLVLGDFPEVAFLTAIPGFGACKKLMVKAGLCFFTVSSWMYDPEWVLCWTQSWRSTLCRAMFYAGKRTAIFRNARPTWTPLNPSPSWKEERNKQIS